MVVPQFPGAGMPAQMAAAAVAAAAAGGPAPGVSHSHMAGVPPGAHLAHVMGPRGPMPPQQYQQTMYRTAMGHPQQVILSC